LRIGDVIDYWTVIAIDPPRRLTLHFGMRAPGTGILEFELESLQGGGTRLSETAYWHPAGFWGLLYWYALVPFTSSSSRHDRAIVRRAERLGGASIGGASIA